MSLFRTLPYGRWPEIDRQLWETATSASGPFDTASVAARWRDTTRATVAQSYAYALGWLCRQGLIKTDQRPSERWPRTALTAYIADMRAGVSPVTVKQRILNLERALVAMEPTADHRLLRQAVRKLEPRTSHARKRDRLQHPRRLEQLGRDLMSAAKEGKYESDRKNAAVFRDGLQIALLARRPLRRRNFVSIEIGRQLLRDTEGWRLWFPAEETKTNSEIDITFPDDLVDALEEYLHTYRPLLAGDRYHGLRLWVTYRYSPQSAHSLQLTIAQRTEQEFGKPVNPHLFRDCAVTAIAIDDPEHVRIAAAVLGHRSFGTTQRHYNLARSTDAARSVSAQLDAIRKRGRRRNA